MKLFSLLLITILSVNTYALTIKEAVDRGLKNSHRLKESQLNQQVSKAYLDKSKSSYMPTVNLNLNASNSEYDKREYSSSASSASISLGYNLFNGFKDKYSIEGAKENYKSASFKKDALEADLKLEIQLAYINFLEKRETLSTKEDAVKLVEKSLKDTKAYYEQGLVAKNSLLETKVSLSKTKQDLIIAKSQLLIARDSLNRLLGGTLLESEDIEVINFQIVKLDSIDKLVKQGLNNRSELKALKADMKEAGLTYYSSKSDLYPKVDLSLSHTQNGGDSSSDDETKAGINLSYNLYEGGANEAQRAAYMYKMQIANEKLKALELDIVLQIKKAEEAYELSLENRKVTKDANEFAQENFAIMENRYKSQLEKTTDFLKARLELSEAKIAHIQSLYYIYSQFAILLRATQANN